MSNQGARDAKQAADVVDDPLRALRDGDHDRYLQVLFADPADRGPLLALFHLNLELARVADHAREPMTGLIRLQWWRDLIAGLDRGAPPTHPVAALMADAALLARIDADWLTRLIDAREVELDATPMARLDDVEAHARATAGALNAAVAKIAGGDMVAIEAARVVGTAYGLLGVVRAVPFVLRRSQPLLPDDLLTAGGLTRDDVAAGVNDVAALRPVLEAMVERAGQCLDSVAKRQPSRLKAAFVPAILARQDLRRLRARDLDVFDGRLSERPPWTTARCLVATTLGRFA